MTTASPEEQIIEAAARSLANTPVTRGDTAIDVFGQHHECPERVCSNVAKAALIAGLRKAASSDDEEPHRREAYGDLADRLEAKP